MRHVVIGAGQVGTAIAEVLGDAELRDIGGAVTPCDVLHICFPYSDDFTAQVGDYEAQYRPSLLIVHSTVAVGTCRALGAVHSPVTGRHPNLAESVRTFVKWFGGDRAEEAAAIFESRGVRTRTVPAAETTEAGKLLQTLQHGWLVALQKEAYRYCQLRGADPDVAYRLFNETYNDGYAALGEPWYLPTLRDMPGPIGGHCVIPNARMTGTRIAQVLLQLNAGW